MKVIYGGETKRIPEIKELDKLHWYAANIFNARQLQSLGNDLKLFYLDDEGDIISVTCQSDLEEAYRIMNDRIKFVFARDEDSAQQYLSKGQRNYPDDSFYGSEYVQPQSILDRSAISTAQSEVGPQSNSQNMMDVMFQAYLQNQVECMMRQRAMTEKSYFVNGEQAKSDILTVEGGPLDETPIETIVEAAFEEQSNDASNQKDTEILRELDEAQESSAPTATIDEEQVEAVEPSGKTVEIEETQAPAPCKKSCGCNVGDLCFKCIFSKVFSLEPFKDSEPEYQSTCISQPHQLVGVAGADFNVTCTFRNNGKSAWPANVKLRLDNGSNVVLNELGLENQCVQQNEELNVTIEVKLPATVGKNVLKFRLVHGDNIEFGEDVIVNLVTETAAVEESKNPKPVGIEQQPTTEVEEPLIETNGAETKIDDQKCDMDEFDQSDDELSVNSWDVVQDEVENSCAPSSKTGQDQDKDKDDDVKDVAPGPDMDMSEERVQRKSFDEQVQNTRFDEKYRDNLFSRLGVGCAEIGRNLLLYQPFGNRQEDTAPVLIEQVE